MSRKTLICLIFLMFSNHAAAADSGLFPLFSAELDFKTMQQTFVAKCETAYPGSAPKLNDMFSVWQKKNEETIAELHLANQKFYDRIRNDSTIHDRPIPESSMSSLENIATTLNQDVSSKLEQLSGNDLQAACNGNLTAKNVTRYLVFDFDGYQKRTKANEAMKNLAASYGNCKAEADRSLSGRTVHSELHFPLSRASRNTTEPIDPTRKIPDNLKPQLTEYIAMLKQCTTVATEQSRKDIPEAWLDPLTKMLQQELSVWGKLAAQEITIGEADAAIKNAVSQELPIFMKAVITDVEKATIPWTMDDPL